MLRRNRIFFSAFRWMRQVLPPPWTLALFAFCLVATELMVHWLIAKAAFVDGLPQERLALLLVLHMPRDEVLGLGLFWYGYYRARAPHPFFCDDYAQWLSRTPWTNRHPLPLGPIHLVLQDLVVLAAAWLIWLHDSNIPFTVLLAAFLIPYLVIVSIASFFTSAVMEAYLVFFGLAAAVYTWIDSSVFPLILLALWLCAWCGMRRSLAAFPWPKGKLETTMRPQLRSEKPTKLGFPIDILGPKPELWHLARRETILLPWLLAAWVVAFSQHAESPQDRAMICQFAAWGAVVLGIASRISVYMSVYWHPISLLGRLATGRILILGYDRVWLPMLIPASLVFAQFLLVVAGFYHWIVSILVLGCGGMLILGLPPRLEDWVLTGHYRLASTGYTKANFIEL